MENKGKKRKRKSEEKDSKRRKESRKNVQWKIEKLDFVYRSVAEPKKNKPNGKVQYRSITDFEWLNALFHCWIYQVIQRPWNLQGEMRSENIYVSNGKRAFVLSGRPLFSMKHGRNSIKRVIECHRYGVCTAQRRSGKKQRF